MQDVRERKEGKTGEGLVGEGEQFGFYSRVKKKQWKRFEQGSDIL